MEKTKVAIVGGGLNGLTIAYLLAKQGVDFQLFEARSRFGGRILTTESKRSTARFDLGPSWFWPGQSRIEHLVQDLSLSHLIYAQYSSGDAVYEPHSAPVQRGVAGISMEGSYRLHGGLSALTNALIESITDLGFGECLHLSSPVTKISKVGGIVNLSSTLGELSCDKVVMSLPIRTALANIDLEPMPDDKRRNELDSVATWMAGHAKVVAEYEEPFWRYSGYSGDVISQLGPLSEIHDASSSEKHDVPQAFALFGFLGVTPAARKQHAEQLPNLVPAQFARIFGGQAKTPINLVIQDWARDPFTAAEKDQSIPNHHPMNSLSKVFEPGWTEALIWSGSETAVGHTNGYLEGAVSAAEQAIQHLALAHS